jgi:ABC-type transport system involved in multi-copper enzyme maturation permease subunit
MTGGLLSGVALVARHEFRVRLRTGRWRWVLAAWVVVVALFTWLLYLALRANDTTPGVPMFGGLMLFVLALVLIVSPALTAQSINGDRERGTLATLQATRLSAAQIALGKLVAAWGVGLVALTATLPFVGWALLEGSVGLWRPLAVLAVVAFLIGVVCAVSQALSGLVARSITSALLSYVVVFTLTVGTFIAFGLSLPLTAEKIEMRDYDGRLIQTTQVRPDRVWWLLAPNPFLVLADAAPQLPERRQPATGDFLPRPFDPLGTIGHEARRLRDPRFAVTTDEPDASRPIWPYGLGFNVLLGAGAVWLSIRRLQTPAGALGKGVRLG